jgi:formate dehydrogenase
MARCSPSVATDAHHGMTPRVSGTSLSAQARCSAGTREILECWLEGQRPNLLD